MRSRSAAACGWVVVVCGVLGLACASTPPRRAPTRQLPEASRPPAVTRAGGLVLETRTRPPGAPALVVVFPTPRPAAPTPNVVPAASKPRSTARYRRAESHTTAPPERPNESCLTTLDRLGVSYRPGPALLGVKTPVEILGPIGGVDLAPNGARPPVMDCELARTLAKVAPLFRDLGITGFTSSGAYNYRTRRRSSQLSTHAFGLAIDVHGFETHLGHLDVEHDYPRDAQGWRGVDRRSKRTAACVGSPRRREGRLLRTLACELRAHPSIRLVLSPDDDADHHNHLHIEAYPGETGEAVATLP